jgi:hypothetical protein
MKKALKNNSFHYINENGEEVIIPKYPTRMTKKEQEIYEKERKEYWLKKIKNINET